MHGTYAERVRDYKRELVTEALTACRGDTKRAAQMLGVARQNLYRLMKELGVVKGQRQSFSDRESL